MGTKRGVCPYCQSNNLNHRIFLVNPEAATVFCPTCMREMEPKLAIDSYNKIIEKMLKKADHTLLVACDPVTAYRQYANVLEIEKNNSKALLGRILCLIYTSKVRVSYLVEATELLETITHKGVEELNNYVASLKKINFALDEYDQALYKRLTVRNAFYDEECLKLYLKHLYDIIKFKKNILGKLIAIKKDYASQDNEVLINMIDAKIEEKEVILKREHPLLVGTSYKYLKIMGEKVYLEQVNSKETFKFLKKRLPSLNETKGSRVIKDQVFKDYTPVINAMKMSSFFVVLFFLCAAGCGTASYFFYDRPDLLIFAILVSLAGVFFVLFISFVLLHFIWRKTLKKRKARIAD